MVTKTETKNGSDLSGSSGDSNRILTLSNTSLTSNDGFLIYVSGLALSVNTEYNVSHKVIGTTITFLNPIWDDQQIIVQYIEIPPRPVSGDLRRSLHLALNKLMDRAGVPIRMKYFTIDTGSIYDDDVIYTQSGTDLWTSGIVLPIDTSRGSWDSILLEQGKIIENDTKLFCHGSLLFTGSEFEIRVQIGSPVGEEYSMLDKTIKVSTYGEPIYKKIFIRQIGGTGSLLGE